MIDTGKTRPTSKEGQGKVLKKGQSMTLMTGTGRSSAKDGQERTSHGTWEKTKNGTYDRYRTELGKGRTRMNKAWDLVEDTAGKEPGKASTK